jgi:hypothetical protein
MKRSAVERYLQDIASELPLRRFERRRLLSDMTARVRAWQQSQPSPPTVKHLAREFGSPRNVARSLAKVERARLAAGCRPARRDRASIAYMLARRTFLATIPITFSAICLVHRLDGLRDVGGLLFGAALLLCGAFALVPPDARRMRPGRRPTISPRRRGPIDEYLHAVACRLSVPSPDRRRVLDELRGHIYALQDARATPFRSAREIEASFGRVRSLARAIQRSLTVTLVPREQRKYEREHARWLIASAVALFAFAGLILELVTPGRISLMEPKPCVDAIREFARLLLVAHPFALLWWGLIAAGVRMLVLASRITATCPPDVPRSPQRMTAKA